MSKPKTTRLTRIESKTTALDSTAVTLSKLKSLELYRKTTIAAAQTIGLPPSNGKQGTFHVFIGVTATGNKVFKANGTDLFAGVAVIAATASGSFPTAANTNTLTMNGTTLGGIIGSWVEFRDVGAPGAGLWHVNMLGVGSGTAATPFSNS